MFRASQAVLLYAVLLQLLSWPIWGMRADYLASLRQETVDVFYHGYSNYMRHAYPEDELRPLTCGPLSRDRADPSHIGLNDALGNYSLTLIDSLSTLAILAGGPSDQSYTGSQALSDFQDGIATFVRDYGDGRSGLSRTGARATGFDLDSKVQVFETVIRGVGGLLSAHLFAVGDLPIRGYHPTSEGRPRDGDPLELVPISWPNGFKYDGQLLRLALDLAERLLPAFYTETGIPYPRVNLRHGIPFYVNSPLHKAFNRENDTEDPENGSPEITETCSAGAGSLTLEFTVLSRLSGDVRFEQAAKRAFWAVWHRRSDIGLIGNGIDAERGLWIGPHSGIGAGMDSFFEYALKSHILLSGQAMPNVTAPKRGPTSTVWLDPNTLHPPLPIEMHSSEAFLDAWHQAHASVKRYLYDDRHHFPYYSNIHRATGQPFAQWIDSLGAFYPGLLALAGEVEEAIEANLVYTALWTRYSALPERWSIRDSNVEPGIAWWPGRPEFIESTYHIYRATNDPWYLRVGEMVLRDIRRRCYTPCGWAGLQDVRTGELQDRMESFFLGETTKYMYLLFDPDHELNKLDAAYIFTTEGHPLVLPKPRDHGRRTSGSKVAKAATSPQSESPPQNQTFTNSCPAPPHLPGLSGSATAARPDLFQASRFTDLYNTPNLHGSVREAQLNVKEQGKVKSKADVPSLGSGNYSIFPWTLPMAMLPSNGTCVAPPERIVSWIEFPSNDLTSSLVAQLGHFLTWVSSRGPIVSSIDGLKLRLDKTRKSPEEKATWEITQVGNSQLAKQDTVFFYAEHVRSFKDEAFTCLRRRDAVEIELILERALESNATASSYVESPNSSTSGTSTAAASVTQSATSEDDPSESFLQSLMRVVSSVFEPSHTMLSGTGSNTPDNDQPQLLSWHANTATGLGAFPVPSILDTPVPGTPNYDAKKPKSNFPWTTVYLAGHACDEALPESAPWNHQVIVMLRGKCSFSRKLSNIPSFAASRTSLQLVIVVDEKSPPKRSTFNDDDEVDYDENEGEEEEDEEGEEGIRPLLDIEQLTPRGMKRVHGVPMVLMKAGVGDYELFGSAAAIGMRRKYILESQGLRIANAVVI